MTKEKQPSTSVKTEFDSMLPIELQQQAGEYVLGTMEAPARQAFEQRMQHDQVAAAAVAYWERSLAPLAESVDPVTPPKKVWKLLRQRLQPIHLRRQLRWWQGLAVAASIFAVAMVFTLAVDREEAPIYYQETVLLQNEAQQPLWLLRFTVDGQQIAVDELNPSEYAAADNDFELWVVRADNTVRSLGLLPKQGRETLDMDSVIDLDSAVALAVSLEARGGSKTGQPSEQVLYQVKL